MGHHIRNLMAGGLIGTSFWEAMNGNSLSAFTAVIAAIIASLWGAWRREKRADFDQTEYKRMCRALVDAKIKAVKAGKEDPWPHLPIPGFNAKDHEPKDQ